MTDLEVKLWLEKYGGWILITLFSLVPVVLWAQINNLSVEFSSSYSTFSALGKITALIGYVLYAVNLLLAVRRRWLERFFQGLNRVYIAHHITGGLALAFLAFHPLFLATRYIDSNLVSSFGEAAKFLLPRIVDTNLSYLEVQEALAINAGMIAFLGMVFLLVLTFFVKLPYNFWLFTHRFLGVAFIFSALHILFINSDTTQSALLKYYLVAWSIIGLGAFLYRTVFGSIFVRREPYKISKVAVSGPLVQLELSPMGRPIVFKPGQFIFIRFLWNESSGIAREVHPFSIASGESEPNLRLYVKSLGDYTSSLSKIEEGSVAEIEGAFGRFVPARYGTAPQVWIAGGIGITPFLSMARSLQQMPQHIYLVYSVATRSEMVEENILADFLPKNFSNFTFIPYITDEQNGKFLNADFISDKVEGYNGKEIFLCGPPPMMKSMRAQLKVLGVKNSKIHSEEFAMV
jgi:predicted ferric reductase